MSNSDERHILCAVRGQPTSRSTVEHAIELAVDTEAELTFMLVIATQALTRAAPLKAPLRSVLVQLESIGEFAMTLLQDRAQNRGVERVGYQVRRGKPAEAIRQVISDLQPDVVVLGEPVANESRAIFTPAAFEEFIASLREETEADIVVVETPPEDLPK